MNEREIKRKVFNIVRDLENPMLEARVIIKSVLGESDVEYILNDERKVEKEDEERILQAALLRAEGMPMSYITKEKEFYGIDFFVDESVLIPRPETELLVDEAISLIDKYNYSSVLDLCTGSGAIAIAIGKNRKVKLTLSDISESALELARKNYGKIIGEGGAFVLSDLFGKINGRFDMIVTNPPYIAKKWYEGLSREVKCEPRTALISPGDDGLDIISRIIEEAPMHLGKGGAILIESDYRQTGEIRRMLDDAGFSEVWVVKDLAGKNRHTCAIY